MKLTMGGLFIQKGGKLIQSEYKYNRKQKKGSYAARNVTKEAFSWLFSPVTLEDGVTLRDLLGLVANDPIIQAIFVRDFAKELISEFHKKPARKIKQKPWEKIEYLELYHDWQFDSHTRELNGLWLLGLHGIGVKLKKNILQDGDVIHKKNTRISWSVSFSSPSELAHLPVKVSKQVKVIESDIRKSARGAYGKTLHQFNFNQPTLGQILHGIFYDLSFYGAGDDRDNEEKKLLQIVDDTKKDQTKVKTKPFKNIKQK